MFGILNINKPSGWTSRDVVNRVQRLVRPHKVGHAGTLDPLATGVLIVCIGGATRLIEYVQQMPKEYQATFLLGRSSPSDDIDTEVTELADARVPGIAELEAALPQFAGRIEQVPPAYSAVKIAGQRAYALARRGETFEITARPVEIYSIQIRSYEYPQLELLITCRSGTYVRSLGRDLAKELGTAAVMSKLIRTCIGAFGVEHAILPDNLTLEQIQAHLQPPTMAVSHLSSLQLTGDQVDEIRFGRPVVSDVQNECAAVDERGNLIAVLKPKSPGLLKPHINFAPSA